MRSTTSLRRPDPGTSPCDATLCLAGDAGTVPFNVQCGMQVDIGRPLDGPGMERGYAKPHKRRSTRTERRTTRRLRLTRPTHMSSPQAFPEGGKGGPSDDDNSIRWTGPS